MFTCLGVYAFGFLFMLPQLFLNYKVRLTNTVVAVIYLFVVFLCCFFLAEVGSSSSLESFHVQSMCVMPKNGELNFVLKVFYIVEYKLL